MSMSKFLLPILFLATFAHTSFAYTVDYSYDQSDVYSASSLASYATYGSMMDGLTITVYFSDGTSDTESLVAASGTTSGTATGTDSTGNQWSLTVSGDTWNNIWTLLGSDITGFTLDTSTGSSVFDTQSGGTTNSYGGYSLYPVSNSNIDNAFIDVDYSGALALNGADPAGDLFLFVSVMFYDASTDESLAIDSFQFRQDVDTVVGSINPSPVPEPSTLLLLGCGLISLFAYRKFKIS